MSSDLDLVLLNGPREGDVVQLSPSDPTRLGRSLKGYQIIDPLVSLQHSEVTWEGDCYWIQDLGSATGTFVNDVRLTDKPMVVVPGMRVRIGDSILEVRKRPRSGIWRLIAVGVAIFGVAAAIQQYRANISVRYNPVLVWATPVKQGGAVAKATVVVPPSFIRDTGVDNRGLKIENVTDYDDDGVNELWLTWKGGRRIVTFDGEGDWKTLADLEPDCQPRARTLDEALPAECYTERAQVKTDLPEACKRYGQATGFPDLDCSGSTYRFVDGTYVPAGMDGVLAWMSPFEEKEVEEKVGKTVTKVKKHFPKEGTAEPYLFTLSKPATLAGFLAERGVTEPIHYLVCEDALPDLRPQVLTQSGRIVSLPVGCLGAIDLVGPTRANDYAEERPKMLAFTGTGYARLKEDLAVFLGGGDDDSYMDPRDRKLWQDLIKPPLRRQGGVRVVFNAPEQVVQPIAHEAPVPRGDRLLATEFAAPLPPLAWTISLPKVGRYDVEGCSELDVKYFDWHCSFSKGCGEGDPFMQIRNVGCGNKEPVTISYKAGEHIYKDEHLQGKVIIEAATAGRQIDVLRVRLSYTEVPSGANAAVATPAVGPK